MTNCEYLLNEIDRCVTKAITTSDANMKAFYAKAAIGFKARLENMTVEELRGEHENNRVLFC